MTFDLSLSESAGSGSLDHLVLSLVSLHSSLQRAFNRAVHQLAPRKKPLLRVVTVGTVLVDSEFPMSLPPVVLQSTNWANAAEVLSVEVELLALEMWHVAAPAIRERFLVKSSNDTQGLFSGLDWNCSCTHFVIRLAV